MPGINEGERNRESNALLKRPGLFTKAREATKTDDNPYQGGGECQ